MAALAAFPAFTVSCDWPTSAHSSKVIINEVNCHGRDWVEIVNVTTSAMDLGGWYVADKMGDSAHRYALPSGTQIQPGEHLVVRQEMYPEEGFPFGLKCSDEEVDTVYLLDNEQAIVDRVTLSNVPYGITWGRLPDLTGLWRDTAPTEGEPNEAPAS